MEQLKKKSINFFCENQQIRLKKEYESDRVVFCHLYYLKNNTQFIEYRIYCIYRIQDLLHI